MKKLHCIHLHHHKNTENSATVHLPLPKTVTVPMSQSMGTPCDPTVKKGDAVLVGQKIGDSDAYMSAPIHSGVSGTVTDIINDYLLPNGRYCSALIIETDGRQEISPEVVPPVVTDRASFIGAVRESGCCGLGGAGFPTHMKLAFDPSKTPIDTLVINAAECEPYITADYREIIENPDDVTNGVLTLMKYLEIPNAKFCIENNKPKAIEEMKKCFDKHDNIDVVTLKSSYPQGAEKVIVYSATGRIVGEGELPAHHGCLVMNVSTIAFIERYLKTGMPLISKRLTVDGNAVKNPCNVEVIIGTAIKEVLTYAQSEEPEKLLTGGPMMGTCLATADFSVVKTNNALLSFVNVKDPVPTACIRCGRCAAACPVNLSPAALEKAYDRKDIEALKSLKVMLCMNCGSCSYVCPAKRNLAEKNQLAKALLPR